MTLQLKAELQEEPPTDVEQQDRFWASLVPWGFVSKVSAIYVQLKMMGKFNTSILCT